MSGLHWLVAGRIDLFKKLALKLLPYSASHTLCDRELYSDALSSLFPAENETEHPDLLVYTNRKNLPSPDSLYEICNPGGLIFIDEINRTHRHTEELVSSLNRSGLEVELVLYHGFFARLLTFPLRLLGIYPREEKKPLAPFNGVLRLLYSLELFLHPYVRFLTGESLLIVARHLPPPETGVYDLSIVIPAYNEEKRILPFLDTIRDHFRDSALSYEVLVVDDGSSDATAERARHYFDQVRVVRLYRNFGKGGAVKEGVRLAKGERILISDADGSTPIEEVKRLMEWLDRGREIAIGSRYLKQSRIIVKQGFLRRLISRTGNLLIRMLTGLTFRDTQCGFKLFQRIPAKVLFRELNNLRFGFDFEILTRAKRSHFVVEEVPVEWHDREGSKVRIKDTLSVLWELLTMQFGYLFKFSLAGVLNTIIDYTIHNSLILILGRGDVFTQSLYQGVSFIFANLFSYIFNSGFTFRSHGKYWKFLLISLITLVLSFLSFYGLNEMFNQENDLLIMNILKLSTVAISLVTNYFGYKLLVFKVE